MHRSTLHFAPTKTYGPISVDLREKQRKVKKSLPSRSHASLRLFFFSFFPFPFDFLSFYFPFFCFFLFFLYVSISNSGMFPKTIYFFSVQFILNEISLSHFPTSNIFVKISSLKSLAIITQKIVKIFQLSQNSTKFFRVTRFRETNLTVHSVSSSEI